MTEEFRVNDEIEATIWASIYIPPRKLKGKVIKVYAHSLDVRVQREDKTSFIKRCILKEHVRKLQ